jgi:hypothetical protein
MSMEKETDWMEQEAEDQQESTMSLTIKEITTQVEAIKNLDKELEILEEQRDELQKRRDGIATNLLPQIFAQANLKELKLASGEKTVLKEDVYISIPKDPVRRWACFDWLKDTAGVEEEAFSKTLTVESPSEELRNELAAQGVEYAYDRDINTNTLKSLFRKMLGLGSETAQMTVQDVPEAFSLFVKKEVQIKGGK